MCVLQAITSHHKCHQGGKVEVGTVDSEMDSICYAYIHHIAGNRGMFSVRCTVGVPNDQLQAVAGESVG